MTSYDYTNDLHFIEDMSSLLFLADISFSGQMNGVTRCLQVLSRSFSHYKKFHVTWIHFEVGLKSDIQRRTTEGLTHIYVPLPHDLGSFWTNHKKKKELWYEVYRFMEIESNETNHVIIHIHTLNLIDFALWVKQKKRCFIITHLHCIPWKSMYDKNNTLFLNLYEKYYQSRKNINPTDYILYEYEKKSYTSSDLIICVTQCAKDFLQRMLPNNAIPTKVVYNGIPDLLKEDTVFSHRLHSPTRCLFVGNSHRSKGLDYILQSLELIRMRHNIILFVVGVYTNIQQINICKRHPFLEIRFLGLLPLMELRNYYRSCDIGLIASMQEQCSYVAIEMMMFGLPIVSTAIDGLNEIFSNERYASKIPSRYLPRKSLCPDISQMAEAISGLISNSRKREKMCINNRKRYQMFFSDITMIRSMKKIYQHL